MNWLPVTTTLLLAFTLTLIGCGGGGAVQRVEYVAHESINDLDLATARDGPAAGQASERLQAFALLHGPMPTAVAVSRNGRVFVSWPRWGEYVPFSVAEIRMTGENEATLRPIPDPEWNRYDPAAPQKVDPRTHLVGVQSIVIDRQDRLWILDTGTIVQGTPVEGGPKLVAFDLNQERVVRTIPLGDVTHDASYLNDVRFDLARGDGGYAYLTDSSSDGPNAIVVVDLASGQAWRKLNGHESVTAEPDFVPVVEGEPLRPDPAGEEQGAPTLKVGADGIALSPDGQTLYFTPLAGDTLYRVPTEWLRQRPETSTVPVDQPPEPDPPVEAIGGFGAKGFASDGIIADEQGRVYLTDVETNAIRLWSPIQRSGAAALPLELVVLDARLLWPDTLALQGGYLWGIANQLHRQARFNNGEDLRNPPYLLFRVPIAAEALGTR